jgi:predicted solute-binding protein
LHGQWHAGFGVQWRDVRRTPLVFAAICQECHSDQEESHSAKNYIKKVKIQNYPLSLEHERIIA